MRVSDLETIKGDDEQPWMERIVASVMLAAFKNADHGRLNFLLDRAIGKVREAPPDAPEPPRRSGLTPEERDKKIRQMVEQDIAAVRNLIVKSSE